LFDLATSLVKMDASSEVAALAEPSAARSVVQTNESLDAKYIFSLSVKHQFRKEEETQQSLWFARAN
jgi:hypothetical protein